MVRQFFLLGTLSVALAVGVTTKSTQAATIPAGATGHYVLDGDAQDSSGNAAHGTGVTDVTYSFDATRGKNVANFNGSSSEINVSASGAELTSKDLGAAGSSPEDVLAFTVGFWAKFNSPGNQNVVIGTNTSTAVELVGDGSWSGFGADGGIGIVGGPNSADAWAQSGISLFDGDWHHIVIGWQDPDTNPVNTNGNNPPEARAPMMIWIDNNLADTQTKSGGEYGGGDLGSIIMTLGKGPGSNGGTKFLDGSLSDVTFYERKLTGSEVGDLYVATQIPEPSSVVLALLGLLGFVGYTIRRKK